MKYFVRQERTGEKMEYVTTKLYRECDTKNRALDRARWKVPHLDIRMLGIPPKAL